MKNLKKINNITVFIVITLIFTACISNKKILESKIKFAENTIVAHRGAWKNENYPENSIASLRHAIKLKCTGTEFDVRMTADDSLIVNHDPHYKDLPIEQTKYSGLIIHNLSNGEKLPTLREYILEGIKNNTTTQLVCEIKPSEISQERGIEIASKVVRLVQQLKAEKWVVYISFDYEILKQIRKMNPTVSLQYLGGNKSPEQVKADGISGIDYQFFVFKKHPEWIASAKENNSTLNAWTVNDADDMDWLIANDFDFITTNEPELLAKRINYAKNNPKVYQLLWSDEFDVDGMLDKKKWNYNIGTGDNGWGNNEAQYYTDRAENVLVENGILKINTIKENYKGSAFTSARILTKDKFSFKYGKVEIRAKLPAGGGVWPALWMLGNNLNTIGWPYCGEIDIMEYAGNRINKVTAALHYPGHSGANPDIGYTTIMNADTDFHIYTLEWNASHIKIYVDDQLFFTFTNADSLPFNQDFFLIFNCAMGGSYGGAIDPGFTSSTFEIDYVRVYN